MGSSHQKRKKTQAGLPLVTVTTAALRDKLNRIYNTRMAKPGSLTNSGLFECLWEMKELALIEGLSSIQLPINWLEELESESTDTMSEAGHLH